MQADDKIKHGLFAILGWLDRHQQFWIKDKV